MDSDWLTAHWGWMPAREYTAFLQTGQIGRLGVGTCQGFGLTGSIPPFPLVAWAWCRLLTAGGQARSGVHPLRRQK